MKTQAAKAQKIAPITAHVAMNPGVIFLTVKASFTEGLSSR
jgi:hypothetical protein